MPGALPKIPRIRDYAFAMWDTDLRAMRRALGLSAKMAAHEIGVTFTTYWKAEHGADTSVGAALAIANFFGMTVEAIWDTKRTRS